MKIARVGRAAAPRQFASLSGARAYLPKFSTVALGGTVLVVGGGLAYDRWMTKMHHSEIIWHGSDRGALPRLGCTAAKFRKKMRVGKPSPRSTCVGVQILSKSIFKKEFNHLQ